MSDQGWSASTQLDVDHSINWWRISALAVAFLVFVVLTIFHTNWKHNPNQIKWLVAAALGIVGLAQLALSARDGKLRLDRVDYSAFALLGWVALSLAWSPDAWAGLEVLIKWSLMTLAFSGLRRSQDSSHAPLGLAAAGGLLVIMLVDSFAENLRGGYFNQNFETEAILFAMPLLLLLTKRNSTPPLRWVALCVALASVLFLLFFVPSKIEFLVWPATVLFLALAFFWHRSKPIALIAAAAVVGATGSVAVLGWNEPIFGAASHGFRDSIYPRLELAVNGLMIWQDAPVLGRGAGFLTLDYPIYQERHLSIIGGNFNSGMFTSFFAMAGQLHNEYVQFLAAFGLIGLGIVIFAVFSARLQLLSWPNSKSRLAGLGITLACAANSFVEFPLQNAATAMLAVIGLALLIPQEDFRNSDYASVLTTPPETFPGIGSRSSRLLLILLILATPLTAWWAYRFSIAHDAYGVALRLEPSNPDDKSDLISTFENRITLTHAATRAYPPEELFRSNLYPLLMQLQENTGGRWIQPQIHDQMFATSLTTGMNNILMMFRLEYLLDSGRYRERPEEVAKWRRQLTTNATRIADTWLMEALYCLTENKPDAARAAIDRYFKITKGQVEPHRAKMLEEIHGKLPPELRW